MPKDLKNYLDKILEEIQLGNTLTSITKQKGYPSLSAVYKWMREDQKIADKIMAARAVGAATHLDQCLDLLSQDIKPQDVQWNRERLHHYRWAASKLIGVYGDKSKIEQDSNVTYKFVWDDGSNKIEDKSKTADVGIVTDKVKALAPTI